MRIDRASNVRCSPLGGNLVICVNCESVVGTLGVCVYHLVNVRIVTHTVRSVVRECLGLLDGHRHKYNFRFGYCSTRIYAGTIPSIKVLTPVNSSCSVNSPFITHLITNRQKRTYAHGIRAGSLVFDSVWCLLCFFSFVFAIF